MLALAGDVRSSAEIGAAFDRAEAELGPLDVLVLGRESRGRRRVWYRKTPLPVIIVSRSRSQCQFVPPSVEKIIRGPAAFRFEA